MPEGSLAAVDILIVAVYFVAVLVVGIRMGRGERDTEGFVLGNRRVPWPVVLCSIVATEISAATFVAVPAAGFDGNLNYLQFGIGSILARFFVAYLFISAFYAMGVMTVYEYLGRRFGPSSRYVATGFFIAGRVVASGARLGIATFALALVFNVPLWLSIALFTGAAVAYTWAGGIRSVVWTDVIQAFVFVGGGLAVVAFLQSEVGWGTILREAGAAGKLQLFRTAPDSMGFWSLFTDPNLLFIAVLNGFMGTTAALGTDQDLTQRMLTCSNVRQARRSVVLSGLVGIPVAGIFLMIGMGLWVYYQQHAAPGLPFLDGGNTRSVLPYFVSHTLPVGLRGLLVAGIFAVAMSSVDSALGALSSSAVVDLYRPLIRPGRDEAHYLAACRWAVLVFAGLMCVVAWLMRHEQEMLWTVLQFASVPAGALLGVFLLGLMGRHGSDASCTFAMLSSAVYSTGLLVLVREGLHPMGWSWIVVLGTAWTVAVGALGGRERSA